MSDTSEESYDFSAQIGHLLRRAYQRHTALFQQYIPDSHLTAAQFVVLCALAAHGGCSVIEIVKITVIDQATIRGVIERLKSRQLLDVVQDAKDKRKVVVTLTALGQRVVAEMQPFGHLITKQTLGALNPAECVALTYLLNKMCDSPVAAEPPASRTGASPSPVDLG